MIGQWALDSVNNTDLLTLCAGLPDQSIDCILCDLPYGTTACAWDEIIPFEPMWAAFKRVIKPRGAIVLTASQPFTTKLISSNFDMFKYCLVWDKVSIGDIMNAKNKPLKRHEDICIFSFGTTANKSPRRMNYYPIDLQPSKRKPSRNHTKELKAFAGKRPSHVEMYQNQASNYPSSILTFSNANHGMKYHPTQKPVKLFEHLIRLYTQAGDLVLDPTVGSGTTAVAARNTSRRYIVGDTSADYCEIARERLRQPYMLNMFDLISDPSLKAELQSRVTPTA
jgi:site-specific DNA-methyltransferase (adenine-specific)